MVEIIHENAKKIDDYTLETEKTVKKVTMRFTRDFLEGQKAAILADIARYTAERQIELNEINALLAEMDKLGIVKKPEPKEEDLNPYIEKE